MNKYLLAIALMIYFSPGHSFQWSINEYIDNCSVVHQKTISLQEREKLGYCMGVLKGALAGLLVVESYETGELPAQCVLLNSEGSWFETQKKVLATMRLNFKKWGSASEANTADIAVALALVELYPCLLD